MRYILSLLFAASSFAADVTFTFDDAALQGGNYGIKLEPVLPPWNSGRIVLGEAITRASKSSPLTITNLVGSDNTNVGNYKVTITGKLATEFWIHVGLTNANVTNLVVAAPGQSASWVAGYFATTESAAIAARQAITNDSVIVLTNNSRLAQHRGTNITQTLGYYTSGDGGAAVRWLDRTASSTNRGEPAHTLGAGIWKLIDPNYINVKQFGAYGDRQVFSGAIASNSVLLTNVNSSFTQADSNKVVEIHGAGLSGQTLFATITNVTSGIAYVDQLASNRVSTAYGVLGHNDEPAFSNAIHIATSTGRELLIPNGNYYLRGPSFLTSTDPESGYHIEPALYVRTNGLTLRGVGRPTLHFAGGYRLVGSFVQRQSSIWITGDVTNFCAVGIRFFGGLTNGFLGTNGYQFFPADTTDGTGWDVTHKFLVCGFTNCTENIYIEDCTVEGYRGEMLYAGFQNNGRMTLKRNVFRDCNGSLLNPSHEVFAEDNIWADTRIIAEWNQFASKGKSYIVGGHASNYMAGFEFVGANTNANCPITLSKIAFFNGGNPYSGASVVFFAAKDITVEDCDFYGCFQPISSAVAGVQGNEVVSKRLRIANNRIIGTNSAVFYGITLIGTVDSTVEGNLVKDVAQPFYYYGFHTNLLVTGNSFPSSVGAPAAAVSGDLPLFLNNTYGGDLNGFLIFTSTTSDLVRNYYGEHVYLYGLGAVGVVNFRMSTTNVPDGAMVTITGANDTPTEAAWRISPSSTMYVSEKRVIHSRGDVLVMKYRKDKGHWEEQYYSPSSTWRSAATAPTSGAWDTNEVVVSTITNHLAFICIQGGTNGAAVFQTNSGSWTISVSGGGTNTLIRTNGVTVGSVGTLNFGNGITGAVSGAVVTVGVSSSGSGLTNAADRAYGITNLASVNTGGDTTNWGITKLRGDTYLDRVQSLIAYSSITLNQGWSDLYAGAGLDSSTAYTSVGYGARLYHEFRFGGSSGTTGIRQTGTAMAAIFPDYLQSVPAMTWSGTNTTNHGNFYSLTITADTFNTTDLVVTNPINVVSGGTGRTNVTADTLLSGNGTNKLDEVTVSSGLALGGTAGSARTLSVLSWLTNAMAIVPFSGSTNQAVVGPVTNQCDIGFSSGWDKSMTNSMRTNVVMQLTNATPGASFTATFYGNAVTTNAYTITFSWPGGGKISWLSPTNGNYDFLLNSNRLAQVSGYVDRSTNVLLAFATNSIAVP